MPRFRAASLSALAEQLEAQPAVDEATARRSSRLAGARRVMEPPQDGTSSGHVVGDLYLRAEAVALAGQDPVIGEIVVGVDVVLGEHDLALDALGRAGRAEALLARGQRVEARAARGFEDGLSFLVGDLVGLAFEVDRDVVWNDVAICLLDRYGVIARGLEALEPHAIARHAGAEQGLLDHVHERTGAAEEGFRAL